MRISASSAAKLVISSYAKTAVLSSAAPFARDDPPHLPISLPDSLPPTWTRAGLAALARHLVRGAREPLPFCCAWAPLADGKDEIISSPWREKYNTVTQTRALRWTPTKTWSAQNLTVSSFINCIPAPFYRMSVALVQVNEAEAIPASLLQRTKLLHGSCPCTCFCRPCPWLTGTTTSFQSLREAVRPPQCQPQRPRTARCAQGTGRTRQRAAAAG